MADRWLCRARRRWRSRVRMMSSRSSTAFLLIVVLAAGRAACGQKIAILGVSRFEARISNYWQLDCLSGKAPDFSEKDPLWSLFVCPIQGVSPSRRFQFQKRSQLFTGTHNETLSVVACVHNPDLILTPATLKVCKQVFKVSGRQRFRASLSAPGPLVVVFSDCDQRSSPSRFVRNGF